MLATVIKSWLTWCDPRPTANGYIWFLILFSKGRTVGVDQANSLSLPSPLLGPYLEEDLYYFTMAH